MIEKIVIAYWKGSKYDDLHYEHNEEYDGFSETTAMHIIELIIRRGFNVMTQRTETSFIIWISDGKFTVS